MKKLFASLLTLATALSLALIALSACTPADTSEVEIAYLSGSTGIGMAKMISDNKDNEQYDFEKFDGPEPLKNELLSADCDIDIAALPTNIASLIYNKTNGKYRVVALNTLGVLYLASNNGIDVSDLNNLKGKTIHVPETAPGAILTHVLQKNNITVTTNLAEKTAENVYLTYELNLLNLPTAFKDKANDVEIALLPEPKFSSVASKATNYVDLTQKWDEKEDTTLVQGCIVASTDFIENHSSLLKSFLTEYESSIRYMENPDNLENAADLAVALEIIPEKPLAMNAIPRCNITYIDGDEMKTILSAYLKALFDQNKNVVGGKMPGDDFYAVDFDYAGK